MIKNLNISQEKNKIKKKNESRTTNILLNKDKENMIKEHIKDREKEIQQNRTIQQKNKIASLNLNIKTASALQNYATNYKNKNAFSPLNNNQVKNHPLKDIHNICNSTVEKVEINLDKKKQSNIINNTKYISSPHNFDSKRVNSEEKIKYNFNKNVKIKTSPEALFKDFPNKNRNSNIKYPATSKTKKHSDINKNNLSLKTEILIYSSFQSVKNSNNKQLLNNRNEKLITSPPKSNETSSKKKSVFEKNIYINNNCFDSASNAVENINSKPTNEQLKDLNEFIDNKPTESNIDFEMEEYEELSRINPKMKILEFIANKLVEKSKHLDGNNRNFI